MREDFLHFIWQYQYFDFTNLQTTQRQAVIILDVGKNNTDAGADFYYAKILLNQVEWAGTVEIHLKSSHWQQHQHHQNPQYNNVILHVVWEDDKPIYREDASIVPTIELKNRVNSQLLYQYQTLMENHDIIPCAKQFRAVSDLQKISLLEKALSRRLERKAKVVKEIWQQNELDWEETTYQLLAQNFGFKINAEPFLRLSQALPLSILQKHRDQLFQVEALLFGQAGFLEDADSKDDYVAKLKREYNFLAHKYQLNEQRLAKSDWNFLRLRPTNFPTLRLAQWASVLHHNAQFFSFFLQADTVQIFQFLQTNVSAYWQYHYIIGEKTDFHNGKLGKTSVENILINTVVPLLACYALEKNNLDLMEKALHCLEKIKAEKNHILQIWNDLGLYVKTAYDSQALIEQYTQFCSPKKCLECVIGTYLVRKGG